MSNQIMGHANAQLAIIGEMRAARDASLAQVEAMYPQNRAAIDPLKKAAAQGVNINAAAQANAGTSMFSSTGTQVNFNNFNVGGSRLGCCCPCPPAPTDSTHPAGSLKVDDKGVVTTPGGYKIEATKQHEWTITGPDGKNTRIWGDPHVDEGDGGKWDFKRNSTFVLGDGTRINCTTKPWKDGKMTVSDSLEIISGNDRVNITGIAEGKGKTGAVTNDGFQHVNSFGKNDAFVMGKETDDWSFQGKEIVGSNNGGESFKLGEALAPGATSPTAPAANDNAGPQQFASKLVEALSSFVGALKDVLSQKQGGAQPVQRPPLSEPITTMPVREPPTSQDYLAGMRDAFNSIGTMLQQLSKLFDLQRSVQTPPIRS